MSHAEPCFQVMRSGPNPLQSHTTSTLRTLRGKHLFSPAWHAKRKRTESGATCVPGKAENHSSSDAALTSVLYTLPTYIHIYIHTYIHTYISYKLYHTTTIIRVGTTMLTMLPSIQTPISNFNQAVYTTYLYILSSGIITATVPANGPCAVTYPKTLFH